MIQNICHVLIYLTVMVIGSIMFAKFWVETTNLGPESVANNMDDLFTKVNWGAGIGIAGLFAIVLIRWLLRKKSAKAKA